MFSRLQLNSEDSFSYKSRCLVSSIYLLSAQLIPPLNLGENRLGMKVQWRQLGISLQTLFKMILGSGLTMLLVGWVGKAVMYEYVRVM